MNSAIKFAAGVLGGFVSGYILRRVQYGNAWKVAEQEIEKARQEYREFGIELRRQWEEERAEYQVSVMQQYVQQETAEVEKLQAAAQPAVTQPHDYTQYSRMQGPAEASGAHILATVDPNAAAIVNEATYIQAEHAETLTFFVGDNILVNENYEPITDHARTKVLGPLDGYLNDYKDSEGNVYFQNPVMNRVYQVVIENGTYTEEVLGQ